MGCVIDYKDKLRELGETSDRRRMTKYEWLLYNKLVDWHINQLSGVVNAEPRMPNQD